MARILIADDEPHQLHLRRILLERAGHQVVAVLDVPGTLREIERGWADLVIMDLRFPNAAGEPDAAEGLALIRGIRGGSQVPLIVLSGWPAELYGQPEEQMISLIMLKPVPSAEMLKTIDRLVG